MSVLLAILIMRGTRITREVLNQYFHAWLFSSIYLYCSLFNYWIYRKKIYIYIKVGNRKIHIILTSLLCLLCSSFLVTGCGWLYWVFYTVSLLCFFLLYFISNCTIFWFKFNVVSLNVLHVSSSHENWNGVIEAIPQTKMCLLFNNCFVLHIKRYLLMKF